MFYNGTGTPMYRNLADLNMFACHSVLWFQLAEQEAYIQLAEPTPNDVQHWLDSLYWLMAAHVTKWESMGWSFEPSSVGESWLV